MTSLSLFAILLTLAAVFGVVNARTLRLPSTIGVLVFALLASLVTLAINPLIPGYDLRMLSRQFLDVIDLPHALLNGALSFLLFAGALQVDLTVLWSRKLAVLALALVATLLSVVLFGGTMWLIFPLLGPAVPFIWCIVLGAILAPTDPVSVSGMLRRVGLPATLQAVFAGESLFNDGVGVVVFGAALGVAVGGNSVVSGTESVVSGTEIFTSFIVEAFGGGLLGLALGYIAVQLMRAVDDAHLELILSLALATGAFSLAATLGMSGPIAVVVAGLTLGSRRSLSAFSEKSRSELMTFWSLVDEVLNMLLFLLIGFEVLAIAFRLSHIVAVLIAIPLSVVVRAISVFVATLPIRLPNRDRGRSLVVLTWGGLRGGISVALALGLPENDVRPALLAVSYGVVIFTIIVQGLTIERVARQFYRVEDP
jgi:CPA1 family monovalent cation:H+ antiporter